MREPRPTQPMRNFDTWWQQYLESVEYGTFDEAANLSKEELQALADKKEEYRAIYDYGKAEGMRVVPKVEGTNLKLAPFTNTVLKVYEERDHLRDQLQELTRELRKAQRVNVRFHKILDAINEFNEHEGLNGG